MLFLRVALNLTWGLIQNVLGLAVFMLNVFRPHYVKDGSIVTLWRLKYSSMCLGLFIFLSENSSEKGGAIYRHEYGHLVQSAILGPLYLPIIALPSLLWASTFPRKKRTVPYDSFYPEKWATKLGNRVLIKK